MVHGSAFHPYTRPTKIAPTPTPTLSETSVEETLRLVLSTETLISLAQLQSSTVLARPESPKPEHSPPAPAPILTPTRASSCSEPLQSPASLPNEKSRRKRTTFSPEQATRLEAEYLADSYMAREKRILLAQSLSLSENQVKTWFQNRRAKDKRDRKTDNSSINTHSRKSSPSRKSSSDSSPTPSSSGSFILPFSTPIQTATTPTTVEALFMCPPTTPPARSIQKVEQFPVQPANNFIPNMDSFNSYLQSLASGALAPPSLFNPNLLTSFQTPLQSASM
uniref:Homeobox domain-containing protein n=1 Tax=Caenorhabditis japonica TaxID=281687 RepID=A0A8R1DL02_CAEJA